MIENFVNACVEAKLFDEYDKEYYVDQVMGLVSLLPKQIEDKFYELYKKNK